MPTHVITLFYTLSLLIVHENIITNYSNIADISSRLFFNDFFINSYYLLWTSFWYLPTFIITSFMVFLLNLSRSESRYTWAALSLLLLVTSIHYQNLVLCNYNFDYCGANFNTLLSNSINKFHPALFYISLLPLIISLRFTWTGLRLKYTVGSNLGQMRLYTNALLVVIVYTLYLGSWWALQEGSWGGWWNWDPSEVFGLCIMVYYLYTLHKDQESKNYLTLTLYLNTITQLVLFLYIFIQLNFDLVSHNFGTRIDQFVDTSQNFLLTILFLSVSIVVSTNQLRQLLTTYSVTNKVGHARIESFRILWQLITALLITFILLSSFSLLVNDFLWKLMSINIFNNAKFTYFYTSMLIVLLLLRSWHNQNYAPFVVIYVIYFTQDTLLLMLLPAVSKISILHVSLLSILFLMLAESNQSVIIWEITHKSMTYVQDLVVHDLGASYASVNNFIVEYATSTLHNNIALEFLWNFMWLSSSKEGHSFIHPSSSNLLTQALYSGNDFSGYMINVLDFCINTTNFAYSLLFIAVFLLLKIRILILS